MSSLKSKIKSLLQATIPLILENQFLKDKSLENELFFALKYSYNSLTDNEYSEKANEFTEAVIDRVWERLNIGCWKNVSECLRDVYAYASFLKAVGQLKYTLKDDEQNIEANLINALETIDRGLLLGSSFRSELSKTASSLCHLIYLVSDSPKFDSTIFTELTKIEMLHEPIFPNVKDIITLECPSIETFSQQHFKPRIPARIKGCINHWPALHKWQDLNYILEKIGPRLVPIEIGSSYTSSSWSQKLMTVQNFVQTFFLPNERTEIGYLAQHQLFNQIPELLDDIREPDYCALSENYEDSVGTDVNAWFGPANTISPLHYDPKHNFLAQIVGKKQVFLIDPGSTEKVYPYDDLLLFNTAQVDLENPDYDKFPEFKHAEVIKCILEPGDMLYIPPKWWHHVRSLTSSFSVSFWWGC